MRRVDAIVLAGEKEGSIPVLGDNKAFLDFKGRPLIFPVIEALDGAEGVSSITVVGPENRLRETLARLNTQKPLKIFAQRDNVFENMYQGALSTFPGWKPGKDPEEYRGTPHEDRAFLLCTSDLPLLEPKEVDHFVAAAPLDKADFVVGFTPWDILKPYEPDGETPGIKFLYYCFAETIVRHSNLFLFRPLRLGKVVETYIPIAYRLRYQRRFKNVLSTAFEVATRAFHPMNLYLYLMLQWAKAAHYRGYYRACDFLRKTITIERAAYRAFKITSTRAALQLTIGPGPTLDVDDEDNFRVLDAMYDRWKEIQKRQLEKAAPETPAE